MTGAVAMNLVLLRRSVYSFSGTDYFLLSGWNLFFTGLRLRSVQSLLNPNGFKVEIFNLLNIDVFSLFSTSYFTNVSPLLHYPVLSPLNVFLELLLHEQA